MQSENINNNQNEAITLIPTSKNSSSTPNTGSDQADDQEMNEVRVADDVSPNNINQRNNINNNSNYSPQNNDDEEINLDEVLIGDSNTNQDVLDLENVLASLNQP